MICEGCGATGWRKTCRWRTGIRRFVLCDDCWRPISGSVWIVRGEVNVTSRCDLCGYYVHPEALVTSRPGGGYKRDLVSTGICGVCENGDRR